MTEVWLNAIQSKYKWTCFSDCEAKFGETGAPDKKRLIFRMQNVAFSRVLLPRLESIKVKDLMV